MMVEASLVRIFLPVSDRLTLKRPTAPLKSAGRGDGSGSTLSDAVFDCTLMVFSTGDRMRPKVVLMVSNCITVRS